jgi:RES domain-containing protein
MLVYRITHKNFSKNLIASGAAGRWNSEGKKVIYAAESIALAFLENMVRRQGVGFNRDFKIVVIEIPDDINLSTITTNDLKAGWRNFKDYSRCQPLGDEWYRQAATAVLRVPSAGLTESNNFVINILHSDYVANKIKMIGITDLLPDERIRRDS